MNTKQYIAIFDEQKISCSFFHKNLECFHQYHVLFSCATEKELMANLQPSVIVLIMNVHSADERNIAIIKSVLRKFECIKILILTPHADALEYLLASHRTRIRLLSYFNEFEDFFYTLQDLMPDHVNHLEDLKESRKYNLEGFDKLKLNRQWQYILDGLRNGKSPKELENKELKWKTINTYIENMLKETGCGTTVELFDEAKRRGII